MVQILGENEIENKLRDIDVAWSAIPGQGLVRVFDTGSFAKAMQLANKIADIAEAHNHHPELHLAYGELEVVLFTHSVAGVTQQDFDLAHAIDQECG